MGSLFGTALQERAKSGKERPASVAHLLSAALLLFGAVLSESRWQCRRRERREPPPARLPLPVQGSHSSQTAESSHWPGQQSNTRFPPLSPPAGKSVTYYSLSAPVLCPATPTLSTLVHFGLGTREDTLRSLSVHFHIPYSRAGLAFATFSQQRDCRKPPPSIPRDRPFQHTTQAFASTGFSSCVC